MVLKRLQVRTVQARIVVVSMSAPRDSRLYTTATAAEDTQPTTLRRLRINKVFLHQRRAGYRQGTLAALGPVWESVDSRKPSGSLTLDGCVGPVVSLLFPSVFAGILGDSPGIARPQCIEGSVHYSSNRHWMDQGNLDLA